MKNQSHTLTSKPKQNPLFTQIKKNTYVKPGKIIILDLFFYAFQQSKLEKNRQFVSFVYATGQKRHPKSHQDAPNSAKNKRFYSGPWRSIFSFKQKQGRIPGVLGNEGLMTMGQMREIAQAPFEEFATHLIEQTQNNQLSPTEPLQWLIMGHSRGGAIARYLANTQPKSITLVDKTTEDKTTVTIDVKKNEEGDTLPMHTATIKRPNQESTTVDVQIDIIAFSATTGPNLKSEKGFTEIAARSHLDFLATGDGKQTRQLPPLFDLFSLADLTISSLKNLYRYAYGRVMKPLNQRRTENSGDTLFLHIPVNHPAITKADPKRILHMEVEVLTAYLNMRRLGYGDSINADHLKIPFRNKNKKDKKWYEREKTTVELKNIELSDGKILSKNSSTQDCIDALQKKYKAMSASEAYKNRSDYINIHGNTDRRFLVLRSGCYATAIEERLALAQHAMPKDEKQPKISKKQESEILEKLFTGDSSPELKKFTQFAQNCLSKTGLNDPGLKNTKNLNKFLLLKTAAILKNEHFVIYLFNKIDEAFPSNKSSNAINLKKEILKFLEKIPATTDSETAEKMLIENFLEKLKPKYNNNIAKLKNIIDSILKNEELNSYIKTMKRINHSLPGGIKSQEKNISKYLNDIIEKLPKYLQEGLKEKSLKEIFSPQQRITTTSKENPKISPKSGTDDVTRVHGSKPMNIRYTLIPPPAPAREKEAEEHTEDNLILSI